MDIICCKMWTLFRERSSSKTHFWETEKVQRQIYDRVFVRNRGYCVNYPSTILQCAWKIVYEHCVGRFLLSVLWYDVMNKQIFPSFVWYPRISPRSNWGYSVTWWVKTNHARAKVCDGSKAIIKTNECPLNFCSCFIPFLPPFLPGSHPAAPFHWRVHKADASRVSASSEWIGRWAKAGNYVAVSLDQLWK